MTTINALCEHERGDLNGNIHVCKKNKGHSGEHSAYGEMITQPVALEMLAVCENVLENLGRMDDGSKCYTRNDEYSYAILEDIILRAKGLR